ncbi:MAG: metallophosphoesterase, partial [Pseudomonadota bacterium]|nr:metallophosphoesterase [Pseudomonadota bacterium]
DWLKADLAAHHAPCALAYWHHPVFSSGGHGNNEVMRAAWQLLAAAGVDLVLSGHDHDYERFAPQDLDGQPNPRDGMRQFVVGTGGAELSPFRLMRANSLIANNTNYGVLRMELKPDGYTWQFMPVADGTLQDAGSARCRSKPS